MFSDERIDSICVEANRRMQAELEEMGDEGLAEISSAHVRHVLAALGELKLPCHVLVPPAVRIKRGCSLSTLLHAVDCRRHVPDRFRAFSADVGKLIK